MFVNLIADDWDNLTVEGLSFELVFDSFLTEDRVKTSLENCGNDDIPTLYVVHEAIRSMLGNFGYYDDVVEGYRNPEDNLFYAVCSKNQNMGGDVWFTYEYPIEGETGKLYVDLNTNSTYRWSGSIFIKIGNLDRFKFI